MGKVEGCNWFPGRVSLHLAVVVGKKAEDQCYMNKCARERCPWRLRWLEEK